MRWLYFIGFTLLVLLATSSMGAQEVIVSAKSSYDIQPTPAFLLSIDSYLNRFLGRDVSKENQTAAEAFLDNLYFVSKSECNYIKETDGSHLICHIQTKRIIRNINISNLPASLLESELRRKLPVQIGHTIDLDASFNEMISVVKSRVETFLKKNGFYGSTVTVFEHVPHDSHFVDVNVEIVGGVFARVSDVQVLGDPPITQRAVKKMFFQMCLSFNRIMEAMALGTFSCYSRELERETTQALLERFAKMGYVQAHIRVNHQWVDINDQTALKKCRARSPNDNSPRCVNLRVTIDKGPQVRWTINVKDQLAISRNAFLRFIGSLFSVEQFSRATVSKDNDEMALDYFIVKEELLKKVTFISAKNIDEQELNESALEITNFLIEKGYPNAEVVPSLIQEDSSNINVNFDVYAGRPHFVNSVRIMPEKYAVFFDDEEIDKLIDIRSMTENGYLSEEKIESARNEIENRLTARGFDRIIVKADLESSDNGQINIVFYVTSRERELIDEIIILNGYEQLNKILLPTLQNCDHYIHPSRHKHQIKFCHNSSFVKDAIDADMDRIMNSYQNNGFLYAKVKNEIIENDHLKKIIFTIYDSRFKEDPLVPLTKQTIKDIIISGNSSTSANAIKRLFPKERKSTQLDPIALKKGLASLRESGRFSRIDHKILFGQDKSDDAYFLLQLAERPSLSIDTSIAFSTNQLFSLEAELEESNLFSSMLRLNTSLGLGLFWGRQTFFDNKLVWPFILGKPLRLTLNAPYMVYDDLTHRPTPSRRVQSKVSLGLEWRLTTRIMPYLKYWLVLTQEQIFTPNTVPKPNFNERIATLDGLIPTLQLSGKVRGVLKPGISYIELDNPFDPRLGVDLNLWTEFSGGPIWGKPPFVNIGTQNRFFIPVGPLTIALQATFMRAFIEPNEDNWHQLKNHSSMDSLGGDRSVRGYSEGKIGTYTLNKPTTEEYSGYFANIANIELRFPITKKGSFGNFSGALFVDQGMLIPCSSLFKCMDGASLQKIVSGHGLGLSVGAAIRYSLPVGPISVDYGVSPLTGDSQLHILFGYAF